MIFENEKDIKNIKQLLALIQNSTLPSIKGVDCFQIARACEDLYKSVLDAEKDLNDKKEKEKQNGLQEKNTEKEVKTVEQAIQKLKGKNHAASR